MFRAAKPDPRETRIGKNTLGFRDQWLDMWQRQAGESLEAAARLAGRALIEIVDEPCRAAGTLLVRELGMRGTEADDLRGDARRFHVAKARSRGFVAARHDGAHNEPAAGSTLAPKMA